MSKVMHNMKAENEIFGEWMAEELNTYLEFTERYKNSLLHLQKFD